MKIDFDAFNLKPSKAELRRFGITLAAFFALVFGAFIPWVIENSASAWVWYTSAVLLSLSLVAPNSLFYLFRFWMFLSSVLGFVNGHIILSLVFFLLIFPVGLILKLFGKDPLSRRLNPDVTSYRVISDSNEVERLEDPF